LKISFRGRVVTSYHQEQKNVTYITFNDIDRGQMFKAKCTNASKVGVDDLVIYDGPCSMRVAGDGNVGNYLTLDGQLKKVEGK